MTTANSITTAQIRSLRQEAHNAGDGVMGEWCDVALAAHEFMNADGADLCHPVTGAYIARSDARAVCADAIRNAAANAD